MALFRGAISFSLVIAATLSSIVGAGTPLDPTFNVGTGGDWFAEHAVPLDSGKILVCGLFTSFNGSNAPYIVRLNEDGSVDPTFKTGLVNYWTRHMAIQPDGKIIIVGAFTNVAGQQRNLIARLNEDGSLDNTFNPGLGFQDKIVPADPNPPLIFWVALQPDGKIVVVGSFAKLNGQPLRGIARLNPDGSPDTAFNANVGTGFDSWGRAVRVLANGQILANGWFTQYNGAPYNRLLLLNSDGTADTTFNPYFGDLTAIYSTVQLPNNQFVVSGHTKNPDAFTRHIERLNSDGTVDTNFVGHSNDRTENILLQADGKLLICGFFSDVDGVFPTRQLARLNADGTLDSSFKADLDNWAWSMAYDSKHRLLVAGFFKTVNGQSSPTVVRLLPDLAIGPALPPQADAKSISTLEDQSVGVTLSGSTSAGGSLTFTILTQPAKGTLTGNVPNLTYTPNANVNGSDSFTYSVSDGSAQSNPAVVTISITPQNDPPVALGFTADATAGEALALTLSGTDIDGDTLNYRVISNPSQGQLSGTPPALSYLAGARSSGTDSFTYVANDGHVDSPPATVTIRIAAVNHAPVASSFAIDVSAGQPAPITLSATDVDGDPITFTVITPPTHGQLSGSAPNLIYTGADTFSGTDTLTYRANDPVAQSSPATVTIHVAGHNHPPTATDLSFSESGGQPVAITLQGTDPDGDALTFAVTANPAHGQLSGTGANLTYQPKAGFSGDETFTYRVSDGQANSADATVTIHVAGASQAPIASNLLLDTSGGQSVAFTLGGYDPAGQPLTYIILSAPSKGDLTGTLPQQRYTPHMGASGTDVFTYAVSDGSAQSSPATVTIHIAASNHPPSANDLSVTAQPGVAVPVTLSGSDPDGDALTFEIATPPAQGQLSGAGATLTYTPGVHAVGSDSFTYLADDGSARSGPATVTIQIVPNAPTNQPPVAQALNPSTAQDQSVPIALIGSDPDGDILTYIISVLPVSGNLTGTPPNITYTPAPGFAGIDSFKYTVSDGQSSAEATVTITVTAVALNRPPIASNLSLSAVAGQPLFIMLGGSDPDGSPVSFRIVTEPTHGTLSGNAPHLTYLPTAGGSGTDSFTYVVNDGTSDSAAGVVNITIAGQSIPLKVQSFVLSPDGSARVDINADPGSSFKVESSEDLQTWSLAGIGTCDSSGFGSYVDLGPAGHAKFFRISQQK